MIQINNSVISTLARSYNILDYSKDLKKILSTLLPFNDYSDFTKFELHQIINQILINQFNGECILKSKLVSQFAQKEVTAAFEIRVNSSRLDFLTINGDTKSFEIKSGIDTLYKLTKQVSDYEKVFEYNFLVIDQKHLKQATKLLPQHYGIYVLEKGRLVIKKNAEKNFLLEPEMQLRLFTKKELENHFKSIEPQINQIIKVVSANEINEIFKIMLKKRYSKKWQFLKSNMNEILPIDYQYFFNHNIKPKVIYGA